MEEQSNEHQKKDRDQLVEELMEREGIDQLEAEKRVDEMLNADKEDTV